MLTLRSTITIHNIINNEIHLLHRENIASLAFIGIAWTQHRGAVADENPAGGDFGRGGGEDKLGVSLNSAV